MRTKLGDVDTDAEFFCDKDQLAVTNSTRDVTHFFSCFYRFRNNCPKQENLGSENGRCERLALLQNVRFFMYEILSCFLIYSVLTLQMFFALFTSIGLRELNIFFSAACTAPQSITLDILKFVKKVSDCEG